MEQMRKKQLTKRGIVCAVVLILYLILPKQVADIQNGTSLLLPSESIGPFRQLSNYVFFGIQFFQKWTMKNVLFFCITLVVLALFPKAEPLPEKQRKIWTAVFLVLLIAVGGFGVYMIVGVWAIRLNPFYMFFYELYLLHEPVISVIWVLEAVIFHNICTAHPHENMSA